MNPTIPLCEHRIFSAISSPQVGTLPIVSLSFNIYVSYVKEALLRVMLVQGVYKVYNSCLNESV